MKLVSEPHFLGVVQLRSIERHQKVEGVAYKTKTRDGSKCIFKVSDVEHDAERGVVKISGMAYPEGWEFSDDGGNEPYDHTFRFSDELFPEESDKRLAHTF
jgi:hypothetical protein